MVIAHEDTDSVCFGSRLSRTGWGLHWSTNVTQFSFHLRSTFSDEEEEDEELEQ